MLKTVICVLALGATLAGPAAAESDRDSAVVRYDDLALTSPAGMRRLELRITAAARKVCGDTNRPMSLSERAPILACLATAKASAAQQVAALDRTVRRGG